MDDLDTRERLLFMHFLSPLPLSISFFATHHLPALRHVLFTPSHYLERCVGSDSVADIDTNVEQHKCERHHKYTTNTNTNTNSDLQQEVLNCRFFFDSVT